MEGKLKFDEFQQIDAQKWEEKLLADLKGKAIPNVEKAGFVINPFLTQIPSQSPQIQVKNEIAWQMSMSFDLSDSKKLNEALLKNLALGIQDITIHWHDELDETVVFNNIHRKMIQIEIIETAKNRFTIDINNEDSYFESFKSLLKKHELSELQSIQLLSSKDFLLNIAFLRATKLFLQEKKIDLAVRLAPNYSSLDQDQDIQCIAKTMIAIAGVIGGADSIELAKIEQGTDPDDYLRINNMIHHILREEAHLSQVNDPLAGSYFLEDLSHKILQKFSAL